MANLKGKSYCESKDEKGLKVKKGPGEVGPQRLNRIGK